MGYTHYFPQASEIDTETFRRIGKDLNTIIETGDDRVPPIAFESDEDHLPPLISDTLIRFNGIGADGHETFHLPQFSDSFEFCKTARKPYDVLVVAALLIAKHHAPNWLDIGSDGDPEDFTAAQELVKDVLGYTTSLEA